jgi:hypothetical protein
MRLTFGGSGEAVLVLGAATALLFAGCGSSPGDSATSPNNAPTVLIASVDACQLVTEAEAAAAVGAAVKDLAAANGAMTNGCVYGSSDMSHEVVVYAEAKTDVSSAMAVTPEQLMTVLGGGFGVGNRRAKRGLGDEAVLFDANSGGGIGSVIYVRKANVVILIAMRPTKNSSGVENLARTALTRLR